MAGSTSVLSAMLCPLHRQSSRGPFRGAGSSPEGAGSSCLGLCLLLHRPRAERAAPAQGAAVRRGLGVFRLFLQLPGVLLPVFPSLLSWPPLSPAPNSEMPWRSSTPAGKQLLPACLAITGCWAAPGSGDLPFFSGLVVGWSLTSCWALVSTSIKPWVLEALGL